MKSQYTGAVLGAAVVVGLLALGSGGTGRKYIEPSAPGAAGLPFSGAVRVGDTLYLSGDIGRDENGKIPDDAETEARLLLDQYRARLEKAGMTMDDLVFVQVFCSDVSHYDAWNRAYRTYFKKEFPARAFVGAGRLLFGARFEMQGIAVKR